MIVIYVYLCTEEPMPKLHRLQAHEDLTTVLDGVEPRAIDFEAMLSTWVRQWFLKWIILDTSLYDM